MRRFLHLTFSLLVGGLLLVGTAHAQSTGGTVSGTVVDGETGTPLVGVNVFITNTLLGTATNEEGFFLILGLPLGTHELVVSHVGYETQSEVLRFTSSQPRTVDFEMAARILESEGIEVTAATPKTRRGQLDTFRKFFLGVSQNASKTDILNPEVLTFNDDEVTGRFTAAASEPLLIQNRALGYQINFILEDFELREEDRVIRYRGRAGFTELQPESQRQARRWERARLRAYRGSPRHFLASLVADRLWEEGFMLLSEATSQAQAYAGVPGNRPAARVKGIMPAEILRPGELPFEHIMEFPGYVKVLYSKEIPSGAYLRFRDFARRGRASGEDHQISWIALNQPQVIITTEGHVENAYALTKFGYWYFERIAELLPKEYRPEGSMQPREALAQKVDFNAFFEQGVEAYEKDDYAQAVNFLAPLVQADPGYLDPKKGSAAYWLGRAHQALDQPAMATEALLRGLEAIEEQGRFEVRLADAFVYHIFEMGQQAGYEAGVLAYLTLLEQLDQPLEKEEEALVLRHFARLIALLDEEVREEVVEGEPGPVLQRLQARPNAGEVLATWWRSQDPLPGTAVNERIIEHLERVAYALRHFGHRQGVQGYDDRGTIYVRFGMPPVRTVLQLDLQDVTVLLNTTGMGLPGPMVVPPNEFWAYRHLEDHLARYLFILKNGRYQIGTPDDMIPQELLSAYKRSGYREGTDPASGATATIRVNEVMAAALLQSMQDLYSDLAAHHPGYEEQLRDLEMVGDDLRYALGSRFDASRPGSTGGFTGSASALTTKFDAIAIQEARRRDEVLPPSYSAVLNDFTSLPVAVRAARFLDEDGSTRTQLFWSHFPGSLHPTRRQRRTLEAAFEDLPERYLVDMAINLQSQDYRQQVPTDLTYFATDLAMEEWAPVQTVDVAGSTQPYHLFVQWDQYVILEREAEETPTAGDRLKTGIFRLPDQEPLNADPQTLELSDLKPIYLDQEQAALLDTEGTPLGYPFLTIAPETPLGLYFEVYHLAFDAQDQTRYLVEYEIIRDQGEGGEKRTSGRTPYTGTTRSTQDFISLDLSTVSDREGSLDVVVRVTDQVTGHQAERAISFNLIDVE